MMMMAKRVSMTRWPNRLISSLPRVSELSIEKLKGSDEGVTVISMNRPSTRNALGQQMVDEYQLALNTLRFDTNVRVLILQSLVPRVFCAGADLKERAQMSQSEAAATVYGLRKLFTDLEDLPMPVIAAIEGAALGGGLEMALACDFRIAGVAATFGTPETSLAIIPGAGGTQRLPRLVGISKAKELIYTARRISGEQAEKIGLVDYVVKENMAYDRALELAREILPNGPVGVRMAKEAIQRGIQVDIASGLSFERACYAQVIPTSDRTEGLAAFREKRKPEYTGK